MDDIKKLLDIMARLRDPIEGCPWDLEQSFASVAPYTIEEAYEVADAIERGATDELADELGDLLFQVVFHARLAEEAGQFAFGDVVARICDKMERRHPHVFGGAEIRDARAQSVAWETIKAEEKGAGRVLDDVPLGLPGLTRAVKLTKRASRVGFDWPDAEGPRAKVAEELAELDEARANGDRTRIAAEFGDVLFALANLARHLELDPENCVRQANGRFAGRFGYIERAVHASGGRWDAFELAELDGLWERAKATEDDD
jgi:tetrapyrrole methylase family protein/MazG family protein/ATP diphosphatase